MMSVSRRRGAIWQGVKRRECASALQKINGHKLTSLMSVSIALRGRSDKRVPLQKTSS